METPDFLRALVDDAAIFPPGSAPLDRALSEYRAHLHSTYAALLGGFVVSDRELPRLCELASGGEPVAVNLVVTGGAGAIEGAVRWAMRSEAVELRALEVALRDEDDLAHNAQRVLAALDATEDLGAAEVYVEPPPLRGEATAGWLGALDELAAREVRLKFRTGGVAPEAFPSCADLAASIEAALDRELAFKCTAGLHRAVRHADDAGVVHHGFLNVLRATRAALDGDDATGALGQTDTAQLLAGFDAGAMARTRRWFTSFGSCSVREPYDDLVALGWMDA